MTTVALKEDARTGLPVRGDDALLRTMLPEPGTARGGEDVTGIPPVRDPGGGSQEPPIASR